ncbi:putative alpha/Beta hydrolase [Medicago truncatula]|uniref:Alpha/beta-hydrolase superfamily protein n=1 Tax=Medicago truncatula TaxID=3880 RepID=G7J403_MEDTR|nr:putative lipase ROG1 [Medicago truncatula]AES73903.2 alpha/beta-hydrolase superfamily protein [Medicago truncatula]RHN70918.1 putative alpha/Beta hydrolase [Medicago truncatula]
MESQQIPKVQHSVVDVQINNKNIKKLKFPKFGCFRIQHDATGDGFDIEVVDASGHRSNPTHLIIMVNGLIGSAHNWKYAAKQFLKRYPYDVIVHCSECNSSTLTFDGVDVTGNRLAEEVISVIKRHPSVRKISFIAHSLGGLIARYAIAKLYERDISKELSQGNVHCEGQISNQECHVRKYEGKIAGLEPINFITSATPHLGCRGHKQVPLLCGFHSLEKTASRLSRFLGKTGKHLFLTDGKNEKPPLLLQMVRDSEDIKFMSALRSFKRRVAYANIRYDQLVGWSTSSIRRRNELPKGRHFKRHEKYLHIVNVETTKPTSVFPEEVPSESKVSSGSGKIDFEEEMIRGLTTVSWDRIDVSFSGSRQKYLAHNAIQVQTYRINSDGVDVVQHMIDDFQL